MGKQTNKTKQKKAQKKRAREKENKRRKNIRNNSAPPSLEYTHIKEYVKDNYKNVDYRRLTGPFIELNKLVTTSEQSTEIQAITVHALDSLVAYTPDVSRQQLDRCSQFTEFLTPGIQSKTIYLTGYIAAVKFGLSERGLKHLVQTGNVINPQELNSVKENTAAAILLSCPQIFNPHTDKLETLEDSHLWLYLNCLVGSIPLNQKIYLGDTIDIVGTLVKYDASLTEDNTTYKWGIDVWSVMNAGQCYIHKHRYRTTHSSISRLVPILEFKTQTDKSGSVGEISVLCTKDDFLAEKAQLKKVFKEVNKHYVWSSNKGETT